MVRASDGAELHVYEQGSGEPLLLLHGLTGTGQDWRHVFDLDALAARYRVIAPDARGHGRSTDPSGAFGFERCARDVLAILDHLGLERVCAVGSSLGGKTLLHVATLAPERIEAMVRAQHVQGDAQIAALWALPARFAENPAETSFAPERLAAITARTLIVAGDRDPLYPVELAVELSRGIRGALLHVVPGGGHGPIYGDDRPDFERRALAFLASPAKDLDAHPKSN